MITSARTPGFTRRLSDDTSIGTSPYPMKSLTPRAFVLLSSVEVWSISLQKLRNPTYSRVKIVSYASTSTVSRSSNHILGRVDIANAVDMFAPSPACTARIPLSVEHIVVFE